MAATDTKELIKKLTDEDDEVIIATLELLKDKGNATVVPALLDLLLTEPSYSITQQILELLNNMKVPAAMDMFLQLFAEKKYSPVHHHLLSVLWNGTFGSKVNHHLLDIVKIGVSGDYRTMVEALTVIENLEAPFDEEQLLEGISFGKDFLATQKDSEKSVLVKELVALLEHMDNTNSDIDIEEI
ncbi:MAG: HEAT repeat domain-containing protein [Bacteroidota bacterium]